MSSSARARANHKLYLARILIGAWRESLDREDIPASTLDQAYFGAVRAHLVGAYGWFLLELSQLDQLPQRPPGCCAQLPPLPRGRAEPGEIREFRQLEGGGWLAELLEERDEFARPARRSDPAARNLVSSTGGLPGPDAMLRWCDQLETLFQRMGEFTDES